MKKTRGHQQSAARRARRRRGTLFALGAQRRRLDRLGEQHLLGEDEVGAVVVGELEVVAHRDRVERAGDLAVAAEDAAADVDLVDRGVALAGRDAVLGRVLGGDDADAVGRAGGGAQRAADALLEAGVLEAVELVAAAEARVDRHLLLGVLDRVDALDDAREASSSARAASRRRRGRRRRRRPARAARWTAIWSSPGDQRAHRVHRHDDDRRHERVERRERQQDLPAEAHQLVVAQARQRRADPDEEGDEEQHLRRAR